MSMRRKYDASRAAASDFRRLGILNLRKSLSRIECETGRLRQPGAQMWQQVATCATGSPGRSRRKKDLAIGASLARGLLFSKASGLGPKREVNGW